jgi:PadR family transcriptional regulator, regulatory protein PadR
VIALDESTLLAGILLEMRRGTLTLAILSQLKQPCYGYSLLQLLEQKHVNIEPGTLYPLLRRLEAQGLLESRWDTAESRPRKYYLLNGQGLALYSTLKDEWRHICEDMECLMKEEENEQSD